MTPDEIPVAQRVSQPETQTPKTQASGRSMATLIFGILSLVCAGFVTGIPAIILGLMELKAIRNGEAPKEGESISKVGLALGIAGTLLTFLALLAFIAIIALGISLGASGALNQVTSV